LSFEAVVVDYIYLFDEFNILRLTSFSQYFTEKRLPLSYRTFSQIM
jgi:hypothetical protein